VLTSCLRGSSPRAIASNVNEEKDGVVEQGVKRAEETARR
jgi:hypothetical protein